MLLSDVPAIAAHHAPDVTAVRFQDRAFSYAQLLAEVKKLSREVASLGDAIAHLKKKAE